MACNKLCAWITLKVQGGIQGIALDAQAYVESKDVPIYVYKIMCVWFWRSTLGLSINCYNED